MKSSRSRAAARQTAFKTVRHSLLTILTLLFSITSACVVEQDNVGDESTVVYPASYFVEYEPVTALDMLNRIPGMEQSGSSGIGGSFRNVSRGGRGLGSGSSGTQILLNGKRTAGKNNTTRAQLTRIDAEQVEYIEIIQIGRAHV